MLKLFRVLILAIPSVMCIYEHDMTLKVDPGTRTCLYQAAKPQQMLEVQYEVISGQHGSLEISFSLKDPEGNIMVEDVKKLDNALVYEIELEGDYEFCFDNSYSIINSKLVYFYVSLDEKNVGDKESDEEIKIETEEGSGDGVKENDEDKGVLEWMGQTADGEEYYIEISYLAKVFTRILKNIGKARHMLDVINAQRSRDMSVMAEDRFTVDTWSILQILIMLIVGVIQVIMVKQLFNMHK